MMIDSYWNRNDHSLRKPKSLGSYTHLQVMVTPLPVELWILRTSPYSIHFFIYAMKVY